MRMNLFLIGTYTPWSRTVLALVLPVHTFIIIT